MKIPHICSNLLILTATHPIYSNTTTEKLSFHFQPRTTATIAASATRHPAPRHHKQPPPASQHFRLNKFVRRLHEMLLSEQGRGVVEWRRGSLILHSINTIFAKEILPKYFGSQNFKTFRRQLNYYGENVSDFLGMVHYLFLCTAFHNISSSSSVGLQLFRIPTCKGFFRVRLHCRHHYGSVDKSRTSRMRIRLHLQRTDAKASRIK